jgi:hypothetical protein
MVEKMVFRIVIDNIKLAKLEIIQDQSRYEHNSTILGRNISVFYHPPNASDVSPTHFYFILFNF